MTENEKANDRLEEIKQEEKEDASAYYSQGDSKDEGLTANDYEEPLEPVNPGSEEMSFLKTLAFLGFGLAALAIVLILFFIRDLDERVVNTDKKVDSTASTVAKIDEEIGPFKKEVNEKVDSISTNVDKLQGRIGDYERMMAIMELKRAMVAIQEVMGNSNSSIKSKSGEVVSSIETLLTELDGAPKGSDAAPAVINEKLETPIKKESVEEIKIDAGGDEEVFDETNEQVDATEDFENDEGSDTEGEEEDLDEDSDAEGEEEDVAVSTEELTADTIPSLGPAEEHVGEITLAEDAKEEAEVEEELPPIDELLKE